jgi:hypothetical protein
MVPAQNGQDVQRQLDQLGYFLCRCLFKPLDIYGDRTVCEVTPGSIANNTSFSNVATILPRHAAGFIQELQVASSPAWLRVCGMMLLRGFEPDSHPRENIMLISRARSNGTDMYRKLGNESLPIAPRQTIEISIEAGILLGGNGVFTP